MAQADPEGFGTPYWAYDWAGGLVLARYLLDHPEVVEGRRVLDLGAGAGVVGIVAARAEARSVTAVDVDPYAIAALGLNAAANGVRVVGRVEDPLDGPPPGDVDLVLAGDLFYAAELATRAAAFMTRCRAVGLEVLVGDPGRAYLPTARLERRASYAVPDFAAMRSQAAAPSVVYAFVG